MKILAILGSSKDELKQKQLNIVAKELKRNQEKLIDDLESKSLDLEAKKNELESVTFETVNKKTWNEEYHKVLVETKLLEAEIKIAKETLADLFADDNTK